MVNSMPLKLSILVSTYNHEKFIDKCLDSILSSDIPVQYEVIVGNDCSIDDTGKILERYKEMYPEKVTVIQRDKNIGANSNFVDLLFRATGEYVAIVDGDDYVLPNKFRKQISVLDNNPVVSVVHHNAFFFNGEKYYVRRALRNLKLLKRRWGIDDIVIFGNEIIHSSKMFRKDTLEKEEVKRFITQTMLTPDYLVNIMNLRNGWAYYIPQKLAVYRVHPDSITKSNKKIREIESRNEIFEYIKDRSEISGRAKKIFRFITDYIYEKEVGSLNMKRRLFYFLRALGIGHWYCIIKTLL